MLLTCNLSWNLHSESSKDQVPKSTLKGNYCVSSSEAWIINKKTKWIDEWRSNHSHNLMRVMTTTHWLHELLLISISYSVQNFWSNHFIKCRVTSWIGWCFWISCHALQDCMETKKITHKNINANINMIFGVTKSIDSIAKPAGI